MPGALRAALPRILPLPLPLPRGISQTLPVSVGVLGGTDARASAGWLTCARVRVGPRPFSHGTELGALLPVGKAWALGGGHWPPPQQSFLPPREGQARHSHTGHTRPLRTHYKYRFLLTHIKGCTSSSAEGEAARVPLSSEGRSAQFMWSLQPSRDPEV